MVSITVSCNLTISTYISSFVTFRWINLIAIIVSGYITPKLSTKTPMLKCSSECDKIFSISDLVIVHITSLSCAWQLSIIFSFKLLSYNSNNSLL